MKRTIIIAGIIASAATQLAAQNIKGKVVDNQQRPIEAATVIMQAPDSTFIDAVITDSLGYFSFKEEPEQYRLIFQHLLYKRVPNRCSLMHPEVLAYSHNQLGM